MKLLIVLTLIFLESCVAMPKKNIKHDIKQDENFQTCEIIKIINECHILIRVGEKMFVSKLAGLSFETSTCQKSWTKKKIRELKICILDDLLKWRSDNYHLYFLDVSRKKDFTEVILVCKNLNGYYNFNRLLLTRGGAVFETSYKGPYSTSLSKSFQKTKDSNFGLFGEFDREWYERVTPKGFNLDDFFEGPPAFLGEWTPTPQQIKEMKDKKIDINLKK